MKGLQYLVAAMLVAALVACGGGGVDGVVEGSAPSTLVGEGGGGEGGGAEEVAAPSREAAPQPQTSWKLVASQRIAYSGTVLSSAAIQYGSDLVVVFGGPTPDDSAHLCATNPFKLVRFSAGGVSTATFSGAVHAREMVASDFNGDGAADFFSANTGCDADPYPGETNSLLLSQSDGSYGLTNHLLPPGRSFTHSAAAGDIDGDGDNDIVVVPMGARGEDKVGPHVLRNDGATFTRVNVLHPSITWVSSSMPAYSAVKLVDLNGDGKLDLVLGGSGNRSVAFLNVGGGFAGEPIPLPKHSFENAVVTEIQSIALKGKVTLLIAQTNNEPSAFYQGARVQAVQFVNGSFVEVDVLPPQFSNSQWIQSMHVADINGDGIDDVVIQNARVIDGDVLAFTGTAEGKLVAAARTTLSETVDSLMIGRLNGKTVLVSAKRSQGAVTVNVYENQ